MHVQANILLALHCVSLRSVGLADAQSLLDRAPLHNALTAPNDAFRRDRFRGVAQRRFHVLTPASGRRRPGLSGIAELGAANIPHPAPGFKQSAAWNG